MQLTIKDAPALAAMAGARTGVLTFECNALGLYQGIDDALNNSSLRGEFMDRAKKEMQRDPSLLDQFVGWLNNLTTGSNLGRVHAHRMAQYYWQTVQKICFDGKFQRAVADLDDHEVAVLGAVAAQAQTMGTTPAEREELEMFLTQINSIIVWAGGRSQFVPGPLSVAYPAEARAGADLARALMREFISEDEGDYRQQLGRVLGDYTNVAQSAQFAAKNPAAARAIGAAIDPGSAAWATAQHLDGVATPFKRMEWGTSDLFLGNYVEGDTVVPVGFGGNESLVTVAQPGAGKTQAQILMNLFHYAGPVVVLDPKLELLELTAGYRQSMGNRILVLNLASDDMPTHRFNVLDHIDRRPEFLWGGLVEVAEFLLPPAPSENNPIFRQKAVELLSVCLGATILDQNETWQPATLTAAIRMIFNPPERIKERLYTTSDKAEAFGCEPLAQSAMSFASLIDNEYTSEDFLRFQSNATSVLNKYRGGVIDRVANGASEWSVQDLRKPGTTLYIRIPYEEMHVYGGYVRLVLYVLIKELRKSRTEQGGLPTTFLLDEVAQLGNLDQIVNVIETGRGFGLRAWIILQDRQQAEAATSKPNLILKTPKVRLFMNPTLETAKEMSEELGKLNQIITGKEKELATPAQLMGEQFRDDIVVLSAGARPLRLKKFFAWHWEDYKKASNAVLYAEETAPR